MKKVIAVLLIFQLVGLNPVFAGGERKGKRGVPPIPPPPFIGGGGINPILFSSDQNGSQHSPQNWNGPQTAGDSEGDETDDGDNDDGWDSGPNWSYCWLNDGFDLSCELEHLLYGAYSGVDAALGGALSEIFGLIGDIMNGDFEAILKDIFSILVFAVEKAIQTLISNLLGGLNLASDSLNIDEAQLNRIKDDLDHAREFLKKIRNKEHEILKVERNKIRPELKDVRDSVFGRFGSRWYEFSTPVENNFFRFKYPLKEILKKLGVFSAPQNRFYYRLATGNTEGLEAEDFLKSLPFMGASPSSRLVSALASLITVGEANRVIRETGAAVQEIGDKAKANANTQKAMIDLGLAEARIARAEAEVNLRELEQKTMEALREHTKRQVANLAVASGLKLAPEVDPGDYSEEIIRYFMTESSIFAKRKKK